MARAVVRSQVQGQVVDAESGAPLSNATVRVDGRRERVRVDAHGRFGLPVSLGEQVVVVATAPRYKHVAVTAVGRMGFSPDDRLTLALESSPVGRIEGELLFRGLPPENVTVFLNLERHRMLYGNGRFALEEVNVGRYEIGLAVPVDGREGIPLRYESVTVEAGETSTVRLKCPIPARVTGRVRLVDGQALGLATLRLGRLLIPTDADGRFDCHILLAGAHSVVVYHPRYGPHDAGSFRVAEGEERRGLEFVVTPHGRALLELTLEAEGAPVEGAQVSLALLTEEDENPAATGAIAERLKGRLRGGGDRRGGRSDAAGKLRFDHLASGRYRLMVLGAAGRVTRDLVLVGAELKVVRLELEAQPR